MQQLAGCDRNWIGLAVRGKKLEWALRLDGCRWFRESVGQAMVW